MNCQGGGLSVLQPGGAADRPLFLCQGVTDKEEPDLVASDTGNHVQLHRTTHSSMLKTQHASLVFGTRLKRWRR